jgi:formate dehydrogenase major subunit
MYCEESGGSEDSECELQQLAYRYKMDSWTYAPNSLKRWPVDASRIHFIMDHNRCIMCRRCVRACNEVVANHTLSISGRGAHTMIIADGDVPFAESSCVSCGTCLQVCPSGALIDRRSAFMGHGQAMERTTTTCMACSVGCGIKGVTRSNMVHRIEGDWDAANGGLLCVDGRFEAIAAKASRIVSPLLRKDGVLREATWDEALAVVAEHIHQAKSVAALMSPRTTNESATAFKHFFADVLKSKQVGVYNAALPPLDLGAQATLADVAQSDCIVVVGGDPLREQKVLGYLARRAVDHGAALIDVNNEPTDLHSKTRLVLGLAHIAQAEGAVQAAERPLVLYAAGLDDKVYATLKSWPAKTRFLPLIEGTNTAGAAKAGISAKAVHGDMLFVLAGDDDARGDLPEAGFVVVQAASESEWTASADVVLPAQVWAEKHGHITNVEGLDRPVTALVKAPRDIPADDVTLSMLAAHIGKPQAAHTRAALAK